MARTRDLPATWVTATTTELPPSDRPEIAFCGRSNVGKSSLINALCRQKKLLRTSGTPGRTRMIHLVAVADRIHLVDLPGYGYARVGHAERDAWGQMVEDYLGERPALAGVVLIVDARLPPQDADIHLRRALVDTHLPVLGVATKIDGVPRSKQRAQLEVLRRALDFPPGRPLPFSVEGSQGRDALWDAIDEMTGRP